MPSQKPKETSRLPGGRFVELLYLMELPRRNAGLRGDKRKFQAAAGGAAMEKPIRFKPCE